MPLVIQALILCGTDNENSAKAEVFAALSGLNFDSASSVMDFAIGVKQKIEMPPNYQDGDFLAQVPDAQLLQTENDLSFPM